MLAFIRSLKPHERLFWPLSFLFMIGWLPVHEPGSVMGITKALSILFLVALAIQYAADSGTHLARYLAIGLAFGLGGDVFLMPQTRYFIPGLVCFLAGHIFYLVAFIPEIRHRSPLIPAAVYGLGGTALALLIWRLTESGPATMIGPVCAYALVILTMGWRGIATGIPWAVTGSLLFIVSDGLLSLELFVGAFPGSHAAIWLIYYGAQVCMVLAIRHSITARQK